MNFQNHKFVLYIIDYYNWIKKKSPIIKIQMIIFTIWF